MTEMLNSEWKNVTRNARVAEVFEIFQTVVLHVTKGCGRNVSSEGSEVKDVEARILIKKNK